jgi:hypothetical protein
LNIAFQFCAITPKGIDTKVGNWKPISRIIEKGPFELAPLQTACVVFDKKLSFNSCLLSKRVQKYAN